MAFIQIENLDKFYYDEQVLKDVSLSITNGDIFAIVGHSGAGKSTLLRCINGLEKYQGGSLEVFGKEVKDLSNKELMLLRKEIGMIFQHFSLMERKTVFKNIALPLEIWGYQKDYIEHKTMELLKLVDLSEKKNSYPQKLSGGQKQRVAIARALALEPKILLSDEATSALDPKNTASILELLEKINSELNLTIVLVTHEMDVVKNIARHSLLLENGHVIGSGQTQNLFLKPNQAMQRFLGEEEVLPKGLNIRLFFHKEVAYNSVLAKMARELKIDYNLVWGRIEKINGTPLGRLTIHIDSSLREQVIQFIEKEKVLWEEVYVP